MGKIDKTFSNLSLSARTRLSELAVEKKGEFDFNNEQLQKFLERALNHLNNVKKNDAEHIAHFLMGIKTDLPTELSDINLTLDDKQKKHLHNALRTNRYGLFGKEKAEKTIEKLTALQGEVNFCIEWNNKLAAKNTDKQVKEEKADCRPTSHSEHVDSKSRDISTDQKTKQHDKNTGAKESDTPITANQENWPDLEEKLDKLYTTASEKYKKDSQKWGQLKKKISNYFEVMEHENSQHFAEILSGSTYTFDQLVESFTMYTELPNDAATKMATERELVNIQMKGKPASKNKQILGNEKSLAQRDATVIQPGKQLSLVTKTKIRCTDGQLKQITLLSCSAPAMDTALQPEADIYTYKSPSGGRKLNRLNYAIALDTLKSHILQCATRETNCKRVVLAGIGAANFLKILDEEHKNYAKNMIASTLAEVVTELRKKNKDVVFTDTKDDICNAINSKLGDGQTPLGMVGTVPGKWIKEDDLMLNAWDPHSLLGNGLSADNSLDGFYGRNSLIHFQHALLCMMKSLSIETQIGYVDTRGLPSNSAASSA